VNTTLRCARPFPWAALESLARSEVELLRDVRGWAVGRVRLDAIGSSLARVLGTRVEVLVRRAGALGDAAPFDDAIGVLLAPADTPRPNQAVLIEAERGLAAAVVSRVLQREPATVVNPAPTLSPTLAGAFAATVVAAARRAHLRTALRVLSAGPGGEIEAEIGRAAADPVVVELTVLVGDDAYAARVIASREGIRVAKPPVFSAASLSRLGGLPLGMPIVANALRLTVSDLASLRCGDALILEPWPLSRAPDGTWRGLAWLSTPHAHEGIRIELCDQGRIVLRGGVDALCAAEAEMSERNDGSELVSAVGDVPVVVKVEIGEARMAARDWASLSRGDVIALGRRVGEGVILRVGGVAVARGELVEIDGEIGVRIGERLTDDGVGR
jgi:type III secretion protein Q